MKVKLPSLRKPLNGFVAGVLALTAVVPALVTQSASAYGQMTERSITMSDATAGADNVNYLLSFEAASATNVRGIIVEFCESSPIIGDATCGTVDGLDVSGVGVGTVTGTTGGTWTAAASGGEVTLKNASAANPASGTPITIAMTGIDNPDDANATFYARIVTYATGTQADAYSTSDVTADALDAGGVALSTTSQVSVSGTVQETLTFCVASVAITVDCATNAAGNPPTLELGDGTPKVLTTSPSTGTLYSEISTNAAYGASIRMRNANACGGLMREGAASCDIAAVNTGGSTAAALSGAAFGMRATSGSGLNAQAPYSHASNYGMDTTTVNENVTTTYGDVVVTSTGVLDAVDTTYTFAAQAGNTTPAGVYKANLTLVAVGSY